MKNNKNLLNHEIKEITNKLLIKRINHIPQGKYYESLPDELKVKKIRDGKLVIVKRYGSYLRKLNLMTKKIGILTSGGDCGGLNAAIRSIFYRAKNKYNMDVFA
mgnify:CR=1 FL=1